MRKRTCTGLLSEMVKRGEKYKDLSKLRGVESNTEKEKGEASDSFKRAGTRWGIGRELYTPIFIWIKAEDSELEKKNGKTICKAKFEVEKIRIEDKIITGLSIINSRTKQRVFVYDAK